MPDWWNMFGLYAVTAAWIMVFGWLVYMIVRRRPGDFDRTHGPHPPCDSDHDD